MGRRSYRDEANEADDFISEYGTGVTPAQVYSWELEDREDRPKEKATKAVDKA